MDLREKYIGFAHLDISEAGDRAWIDLGRADNECEVIRVLSDYPNLESIRLQGDVKVDKIAEALVELPKLSDLTLIGTSFSSLAFLNKAEQLTMLTLRLVSRTTGIGEVRQLTSLSVDADVLTDLSQLEQLQELEGLRFPGTDTDYGDGPAVSHIKDVSPLKHLPKLRTLDISFRNDDLVGFAELRQLRRLSLDMNKGFRDLAPLGELLQLEELGLRVSGRWAEPISSIEALAGLCGLTALHIGQGKVKTLEPVKKMTKLQHLSCGHNHIRALKPLENLVKIRELYVENNAIHSVAALRNLKKLATLHLGGTKVRDISPLADLRELSWLCLNGRVADLSPLASLQELEELHLNGFNSNFCEDATEVDLAPLSGLKKIAILDTSHCPVKNFKALQRF